MNELFGNGHLEDKLTPLLRLFDPNHPSDLAVASSILKLLLAAGAKDEGQDYSGNTLAHYAVWYANEIGENSDGGDTFSSYFSHCLRRVWISPARTKRRSPPRRN